MMALVLLLTMMAAPQVCVETLAGDEIRGTLVAVAPQGVTLRDQDAEATVALETVLRIDLEEEGSRGGKSPARPDVEITTGDGAVLHAHQLELRGGRIVAQLDIGCQLDASASWVSGVRFLALPESARSTWDEAARAPRSGDLLFLVRQGTVNILEGVALELTAETLRAKLGEDEAVDVPRARLGGILFYAATAQRQPRALCQLRLADGQRIPVTSVTFSVERGWQWKSTLGFEAVLGSESISEVDFGFARVRYLADLAPVLETHVPFLDVAGTRFPAREALDRASRDRSLDGGTLMLGGQPARRGIAIPPGTHVVWEIPQGFQRLQTSIGQAPSSSGSIPVTMLGDGRELWHAEVAATAPPQRIELPLRGARKLEIITGHPSTLGYRCEVILGEARLVR